MKTETIVKTNEEIPIRSHMLGSFEMTSKNGKVTKIHTFQGVKGNLFVGTLKPNGEPIAYISIPELKAKYRIFDNMTVEEIIEKLFGLEFVGVEV
jgi:hypothetical protein